VLVGDLFIDEGVHVEIYPLEVEDEVLWRLADTRLLRDISLLLAKIAFIVSYEFAKDESVEGLG
jgi:hypothetical protein